MAKVKSVLSSIRPKRDIKVAYQRAVEGKLPDKKSVSSWVRMATEKGKWVVTVRFVSEEEGRNLNRTFRGRDYVPNVLSFAYPPLPNGEQYGDIVLCWPVVVQEATQWKKDTGAHCAHLVVHGMLHLQGYTHEEEADALLMESRERDILKQLGFPDPYGDET